jgi:hypothetical protein
MNKLEILIKEFKERDKLYMEIIIIVKGKNNKRMKIASITLKLINETK